MPFPPRSLREWRRRPEFLVGGASLLAVLIVGWGAWFLWTTMMRHRATADQVGVVDLKARRQRIIHH